MDHKTMEILDELISHLSDSQGVGLKSMLNESKKPPVEMAIPGAEETGEDEQGIKSFDAKATDAIAESTGETPITGEKEMNDEELEELLKKHL